MHPQSQAKVNISQDEKWQEECGDYLFAFWCCMETFLIIGDFGGGAGQGIGALNTCTKMPFLPQKLAA